MLDSDVSHPSAVRTKTSREPSGDHAGWLSSTSKPAELGLVRRTTPEPSGRMRWMPLSKL